MTTEQVVHWPRKVEASKGLTIFSEKPVEGASAAIVFTDASCPVCGDQPSQDINPIVTISNNNLMTKESVDAHITWNGCLRCFDEHTKDNPIARVLFDIVMRVSGMEYKGWKI